MASLKKSKFGSDDEDDLESLRLAALKSLKPKASVVAVAVKPFDINHHGRAAHNIYKQHPTQTFGAAQTTRNHNRGFRNNGGRVGRNGINTRIRGNPNLISIQVIDENATKEPSLTVQTDAPKLILPQDRYHKTPAPEITKEKESLTNKFDRYKNSSDESDSETDEENTSIPAKRERKNSLEALMDDIDNILEGKEDYKPESDEDKINTTTTINPQNDGNLKEDDLQKEANDTLIIEETDPDIVEMIENEEKCLPLSHCKSKSKSKSRSRSRSKCRTRSRSKSPYNKTKSPYRSPPRRSRSRSRSRSPIIRKRYSPYSRALPNLTLNTDVLNTITMAPLSPRSAAFVLENRQILARRQMSPRRSRSPSPKRMKLSPRRRTRSRSRSPIRKCSLSPRRRSNSPKFSPKRRSTSPRNHSRRSPNFNNRYNKRNTNSNSNSPVIKQSVHKRLGTKADVAKVQKRKRTSRSISLSLSPSPDRSYHKRPLNETTGQLNENKMRTTQKAVKDKQEDPVLLARKKKFELPVELGKNNGVIKLNKPKQNEIVNKDTTTTDDLTDAQRNVSPTINENEDEKEKERGRFNDASDIEIELNTNIDDLWSDEESDNENEGRFKFKSKASNKNTVPTISIRNLTEKPTPKESLLPRDKHDHFRDKIRSTHTHSDRDDRDKSQSTKRSKYDSVRRTKTSKDRVSSKSKIRYGDPTAAKTSKTLADTDKTKHTSDEIQSKTVQSSEEKLTNRRVKINTGADVVLLECNTQHTSEPEIIIENDDDGDEDVVPKDDESDLRAEISRRRAERLQKAGSIAGALPARLLKSALQEVVPKRTTTKTTNTTKGSANAADRKVLIIKSLASSPITKEPANKVIKAKKESGKLPIHMRLGQTKTNVNVNDEAGAEEADERGGERRSKKSRASKRKNRKVVQV